MLQVEFSVKPVVAGRTLNYPVLSSRVSRWLESRLLHSLGSSLVFPAAVDVTLPWFEAAWSAAAHTANPHTGGQDVSAPCGSGREESPTAAGCRDPGGAGYRPGRQKARGAGQVGSDSGSMTQVVGPASGSSQDWYSPTPGVSGGTADGYQGTGLTAIKLQQRMAAAACNASANPGSDGTSSSCRSSSDDWADAAAADVQGECVLMNAEAGGGEPSRSAPPGMRSSCPQQQQQEQPSTGEGTESTTAHQVVATMDDITPPAKIKRSISSPQSCPLPSCTSPESTQQGRGLARGAGRVTFDACPAAVSTEAAQAWSGELSGLSECECESGPEASMCSPGSSSSSKHAATGGSRSWGRHTYGGVDNSALGGAVLLRRHGLSETADSSADEAGSGSDRSFVSGLLPGKLFGKKRKSKSLKKLLKVCGCLYASALCVRPDFTPSAVFAFHPQAPHLLTVPMVAAGRCTECVCCGSAVILSCQGWEGELILNSPCGEGMRAIVHP